MPGPCATALVMTAMDQMSVQAVREFHVRTLLEFLPSDVTLIRAPPGPLADRQQQVHGTAHRTLHSSPLFRHLNLRALVEEWVAAEQIVSFSAPPEAVMSLSCPTNEESSHLKSPLLETCSRECDLGVLNGVPLPL